MEEELERDMTPRLIKDLGLWTAKVGSNNKLINIGAFKTKEEAVLARDNYIPQNNLPHKLSTEYKREEA